MSALSKCYRGVDKLKFTLWMSCLICNGGYLFWADV